MTTEEAVELIRFTPESDKNLPQRWADLGCGAGTFTLALADLLPPGSSIKAVDRDVSSLNRLPASRNGVTINGFAADLEKWVAEDRGFDGIIMANALHFLKNQENFLRRLKNMLKPGGLLLLVEYDMIRASRWVPYPLAPEAARAMLGNVGFWGFTLLYRRPSRYGPQFLYSAVVHNR